MCRLILDNIQGLHSHPVTLLQCSSERSQHMYPQISGTGYLGFHFIQHGRKSREQRPFSCSRVYIALCQMATYVFVSVSCSMRTERVKFDRTQQFFLLLGLANVREVTLLLTEIASSLTSGAFVSWVVTAAAVTASSRSWLRRLVCKAWQCAWRYLLASRHVDV